jgi:adenylosuccinate lyase
MARLWTDEYKYRKWLEVEIALCEVLAETGQIPAGIPGQIRKKARIRKARIEKLEQILRHDVVAFTTHVAEQIGDASRYLHFGLTSTDVVDTGQALVLREAIALIFDELDRLNATLRQKAIEHQNTPMIGRTHGVHAEPITFGLKLLLWYEEMQRNILRLRAARTAVVCGKISGAVGTHAHLSPEIEERVCRRLGLDNARVSSQVLQRDRHAELLCALAIIGATYEQFATEIRHLQRTEVHELSEPFGSGQKGSSAMPHKRNPITCEQICGLARLLRGFALASLENVALWHERDISHSSVERVVLADACTLVHYMTRKLDWILQNMVVYPQRMRRNLRLTGGLVFSGTLLLELTRKGILREEAYAWVQRCSAKVWDEGADFRQSVGKDRNIAKVLTPVEIDQVFDLKHALRHVPGIFQRVFGPASK